MSEARTDLGHSESTLYRVKVKGGGSFLYDAIDVARFARRMVAHGDARPFTVRPWTRRRRLIEWRAGR